MFLHREDPALGAWAIPQASHTWLAWQFASHWGNRRFTRPSPRAEVIAAVLLHDAGWTEFDEAPGIDENGRPLTFDRMPVDEHLSIWRSSVTRAAVYNRYGAMLVASHFAELAGRKASDQLANGETGGARATEAFGAEMSRLQDGWKEELRADSRYSMAVNGVGRRVNAKILGACDQLSVMLCASMEDFLPIQAVNSFGEVEELKMSKVGNWEYRLDPWPFEGPRLQVHCEGRFLRKVCYGSAEELRLSLSRARTERLAFEFVRPSAQ